MMNTNYSLINLDNPQESINPNTVECSQSQSFQHISTACYLIATGTLNLFGDIYASAKDAIPPYVPTGEYSVLNTYSQQFVDNIITHPQSLQYQLVSRLSLAHYEEKSVLKFLDQNYEISPHDLLEILNGAHVILEDQGHAYESWKNNKSKEERISSHDSTDKQYSLRGAFIKEMLFSINKNTTWFQLECEPASRVFPHFVDYLKYKFTNKNQGPYGSSHHTDANPIRLKLKPSVAAAMG